ncbi:hypothetical protein KOW79_005568 [Hemibagrus wyckioides]|uniref:Uncharacterized protein n=1 Tax=Hemibagrus wyckioides TaxID=337641 RepID=A0A9D3NZV0_9TELE|nr:hypothetical protein KOW79_005568 [Hemibagrus wyckioides]
MGISGSEYLFEALDHKLYFKESTGLIFVSEKHSKQLELCEEVDIKNNIHDTDEMRVKDYVISVSYADGTVSFPFCCMPKMPDE